MENSVGTNKNYDPTNKMDLTFIPTAISTNKQKH